MFNKRAVDILVIALIGFSIVVLVLSRILILNSVDKKIEEQQAVLDQKESTYFSLNKLLTENRGITYDNIFYLYTIIPNEYDESKLESYAELKMDKITNQTSSTIANYNIDAYPYIVSDTDVLTSYDSNFDFYQLAVNFTYEHMADIETVLDEFLDCQQNFYVYQINFAYVADGTEFDEQSSTLPQCEIIFVTAYHGS